MLEDDIVDAKIIQKELFGHEQEFSFHRVELEEDYIHAVNNFKPDIILSDNTLPQFTGTEALGIAKKLVPDTPFIFVTGTLSEEVAAESIKNGAWDFVVKERLSRLIPAIENSLRLKHEKEKSKQSILDLEESECKYRNLVESLEEGIGNVDINETFIYVNQAAADIFGCSKEEIIGKNLKELITEDMFQKVQGETEKRKLNKSSKYELTIQRKNGEKRIITVSASPNFSDNGEFQGTSGIFHDITDQKLADEQIKKDLEAKKTLLKELYHRTKNNMQVISSMLHIHSRNLDQNPQKIENCIEFIQKTFNGLISKIDAMALVHQRLYQADDLSVINLKDYISDLVNILDRSFNNQYKVSVKLDLDDVFIIMDSAIPLGLVLNELISNTFKHAFPEDMKGEMRIRIHEEEDKTINIHVSDNGVGIPHDLDLKNTKTLGLQIMYSLIEYQLKGEIYYANEKGLKWHVKLKDNLHKARV